MISLSLYYCIYFSDLHGQTAPYKPSAGHSTVKKRKICRHVVGAGCKVLETKHRDYHNKSIFRFFPKFGHNALYSNRIWRFFFDMSGRGLLFAM